MASLGAMILIIFPRASKIRVFWSNFSHFSPPSSVSLISSSSHYVTFAQRTLKACQSSLRFLVSLLPPWPVKSKSNSNFVSILDISLSSHRPYGANRISPASLEHTHATPTHFKASLVTGDSGLGSAAWATIKRPKAAERNVSSALAGS